jgi:hypothetical protein
MAILLVAIVGYFISGYLVVIDGYFINGYW